MTLSYDSIFNYFLGYITDHKMLLMETQDVSDLMVEWLHKTLSKPNLRRLFSSISRDDEIQIIEFELFVETDEDQDIDFVTDILAKGMVIEWLHPQVKNKLLTEQFFGGKEQKYYAQANQLNSVEALYVSAKLDYEKIIKDRGYIHNPYLNQ